MATIDATGMQSHADFEKHVATMPDEELLGQILVQQGAINAVSWLLVEGCTEQTAAAMLASLRRCAQLVREEARRRGKPELFEQDQTAFM